MHGFSQQFPIAQENTVKPIELGEPGKLVPILSQKYGYFSSIRSPSYRVFHHTWENAVNGRYPYFFQSKAVFLPINSHPMVLYITSEMHGFPHQFLIAWENAPKSAYGRS